VTFHALRHTHVSALIAASGCRTPGRRDLVFPTPAPIEVPIVCAVLTKRHKSRGEALDTCAPLQEVRHRGRRQIVDFAANSRLPAIYPHRGYAVAGGVIAYGMEAADLFRRASTYVDKILKGAKPADLPVEQPTRFELIVNLKTAKGQGLVIPPTLLARADEVIE